MKTHMMTEEGGLKKENETVCCCLLAAQRPSNTHCLSGRDVARQLYVLPH